ncbi:serine/threonine protein kinase [Streptomyces sp. AcH 505]|uniref:serine/threonine-protein kinase n=1 Tax=Streptomyces sp. AcH 505 TaxID=352211 RepID=UPI000591EE55|nr:serine/threonine protein kinase [Streptomyces sp. AcH 505]
MSEAEQSRDTAQDPQHESEPEPKQDAPDDARRDASQDAPEDAPRDVRRDAPDDAVPDAPTDAPADTPRGAVKSPTPEGRLLAGRYRLGGVLGRGGMGTVWRALDETLGRTVAVKELRFPSSIDDDEKRRLITRTLREAKAIARIRNNGAVTVFDVVDEDDRPWIVMELIEGKSLAEAIREDGTLTPRRAAEVGLAILDVLRAAHSEGILHRDVKPSNVLIAGEDGRVVLTDFGIAQVEGDPSVTSTGMLVGAPSYISPERARGHKPGPAADLWSLGGLLYASVEGSPPYDKGSAIATLTAVMTEPLDPPKNAGELAEVIYGLLAKDPALRLDEPGTRRLLLDVINAPEKPAAPPPALPASEKTRVVPLPPVPPAAGKPAKAERAPRPQKTPKPVKTTASASVGAGTGRTPTRPTAQPATPGAPTRPATQRASLTDVVPRRTLVIIAAVVALALIATILAITLSGGDSGGSASGKDDPSASAGAGAGGQPTGDGKDDDKGQGQSEAPGKAGGSGDTPSAPASPAKSGEPGDGASAGTGGAGGGGAELPAGYSTVTDSRFHFSMALPKGFHRTDIAGQNSGGIYSENGGFPRVQVDFTSSPTGNALLAWQQLESAVRGSSSNYKLVGMRKSDYNGYPTVADWTFERQQNGEQMKVLDRGFRIDSKHGYSIMVSCKASEWDGAECKTLRDTAFATFKPKD